ncbi:MAG TPA: galactokinase family protein, partial [Pyrinomonadaceae bacterium]
MFTVTEGNTQGPADADEFIELINEPPAELRDFFDQAADIFISRAPGRLDVMGGIADYSGSLVLEMPIAEATFAAVQKTDDARITIASFHPAEDEILAFEMDVGDLAIVDNARYYDEAKEFFLRDRSRHWAGYVAGVFFVLRHELGVDFENGARILIASRVPVGKGVSSSAALEVATMQAVCSAFRIEIDPLKSATVCQTIENLIVGAPCGVMDQVASHCGVQSALISLLCQPAVIQATIRIPEGIELWGIDSGVRHAVSESDYARVRMGAFMGYRIIAEMAGLKVRSIGQNIVEIADCRWHGYLANLSPSECERS